jgi:replicative DNA helicase
MSSQSEGIATELPHNSDAEEAFLACCVIDPNSSIGLAREKGLTDEAFYSPNHAILWKILDKMDRDRVGIDQISLWDRLKTTSMESVEGKRCPDAKKSIDEVIGGFDLLNRITVKVESVLNCKLWLSMVMDKWTLRKVIKAAHDSIELCYTTEGLSAEDVLLKSQSDVFAITSSSGSNFPKDMREAKKELTDRMSARRDRKGMGSVTSGLNDLDKITSGLEGAEMMVIGADPKGGKTALALKYVENTLWPTDMHATPGAVLVFSLEMKASQLMQRMVQSRHSIIIQRVKDGFKSEVDRFNAGLDELEKAPLFIYDKADMKMSDIRSLSRRHIQKHPDTKLIVVDYLALVSPESERSVNRTDINNYISRGCKTMTMELGIPVILNAQLNRENRKEKEYTQPKAVHLDYGSGCEKDCDKMVLIGVKPSGEREIVVSYQREGGSGSFVPEFCGWCVRFDNHGEGPNRKSRQESYEPQSSIF